MVRLDVLTAVFVVRRLLPWHENLTKRQVKAPKVFVTAHSIIAVLGDGPVTGKTDGVVAYESAHIDGVASELVVRSGHSTQGHPETIEEVGRILREHLERSQQ